MNMLGPGLEPKWQHGPNQLPDPTEQLLHVPPKRPEMEMPQNTKLGSGARLVRVKINMKTCPGIWTASGAPERNGQHSALWRRDLTLMFHSGSVPEQNGQHSVWRSTRFNANAAGAKRAALPPRKQRIFEKT